VVAACPRASQQGNAQSFVDYESLWDIHGCQASRFKVLRGSGHNLAGGLGLSDTSASIERLVQQNRTCRTRIVVDGEELLAPSEPSFFAVDSIPNALDYLPRARRR